MTDVIIKEMEKDDIAWAAEIHKKILNKEQAEMLKYAVEELFGSHIEKSPKTCLVAEKEGKIIGFIVGCIKEWSFGVERAGWIEIIGVEPHHMGQGVGKALGLALLDYYKKVGIEKVYTSVRWDSGDLISFFKSIGFDKSSFINLVYK